jgi:hypothetical protein
VAAWRSPVQGPSAWGLEGAVDVGPYEAQWPAWRCPVAACFHSVTDGDAVAAMASRWRGWSHRADGDGGDRSHWPGVTVSSRAGAE